MLPGMEVYDSILATPVGPKDVAVGETIWAVVRGRSHIEIFGRTLPVETMMRATAVTTVGVLSSCAALSAVLLEVRGHTPKLDLTATPKAPETVLHGDVADQAALFGLLRRIESLGLELLEVHRVVGP
mgnify:CR=1 FL=1